MSSIFTAGSIGIANMGIFLVSGKATIISEDDEKWYELFLVNKDNQKQAWLEYDNGILTLYSPDNGAIIRDTDLPTLAAKLEPGTNITINQNHLYITAQYNAHVREVSGNVNGLLAADHYQVTEAIRYGGLPMSIEFADNEWEIFTGTRIGFDAVTLLS